MDPKEKLPLKQICAEVGLSYGACHEVLRRIHERVLSQDVIVVTKPLGTFYKSIHSQTNKTLNGVVHRVPAKEVVALRGPRFPGRAQEQSVGFRYQITEGGQGRVVVEEPAGFDVGAADVILDGFDVSIEWRNFDILQTQLPNDDGTSGQIRFGVIPPADGFGVEYRVNFGPLGFVRAQGPLTSEWIDVPVPSFGNSVVFSLQLGRTFAVDRTGITAVVFQNDSNVV